MARSFASPGKQKAAQERIALNGLWACGTPQVDDILLLRCRHAPCKLTAFGGSSRIP